MPSRLCCSTASQLQTCFRWSTPLTCNWAGGAPVSLCTLWRLGFLYRSGHALRRTSGPAIDRCYVAAGILSGPSPPCIRRFLPGSRISCSCTGGAAVGSSKTRMFSDPTGVRCHSGHFAVDTPGMAWRRKVLWTVVLLVVSAGVLLSFSRACLLNYAVPIAVRTIWSPTLVAARHAAGRRATSSSSK